MDGQTRKELEQFGWLQHTETTWTDPPRPYWHLYPKDKTTDILSLTKSLGQRYPELSFGRGETHDGLTINTVINIHVRDQYRDLLEAIEKAERKRYHCFPAIYKGFRINIHTEEKTLRFAASISCEPSWPHLHHVYGDTYRSLINAIDSEVTELMTIYVNGGKYPENYLNR